MDSFGTTVASRISLWGSNVRVRSERDFVLIYGRALSDMMHARQGHVTSNQLP